MKTKIYSLQDENGNIRYIGKTIQYLNSRLSDHLSEARHGAKCHRCNWLRNIMARGKWPSIFLIGEVEGDGAQEEVAWIAYFRAKGIKLVNGTDGGDGVTGYKIAEETRAKLSAIRGEKHWAYGKHYSAETCRKISKALKGNKCAEGCCRSKETRKKLSVARKGKILSEEHKRKIGEAGKGRYPSKETRRKLSEAHRGHVTSEETRRKISEAEKGKIVSAETRIKMSKARLGCLGPWLGKHLSEEHRRKLSDAHKGKHHSEEQKHKISEANKGKHYGPKPRKRLF